MSTANIGEWLSAVRRRHGLTQTAAARRAGITERAWQRVEAGLPVAPRTAALVATTLHLDDVELAHLQRLAQPPRRAPTPPTPAHFSPIIEALTVPAWVIDPAWTVIAANTTRPLCPANLALWAVQTDHWDDPTTIATQVAARLRAVASFYAEPTSEMRETAVAVCSASAEADDAWRAGHVAEMPAHEVIGYAGHRLTVQWAQLGAEPSALLTMITGLDGSRAGLPFSIDG